MHALAFLLDSKRREVLPLYALVGDDLYLRAEVLRALVNATLAEEADDLAAARFSGDTVKPADLFDELRTLPFLAPRRVAIVDQADPFVTAHRKSLESYAQNPASTGVLILCVKTWPATTRLAKLFLANGLTIDCKAPNAGELQGWLVKLARDRYQCLLDPEAARLLVEFVGEDVGLLATELQRLWTYVGELNHIQPSDVTATVSAGRVHTIWKVVDAATTGRAGLALDLMDRLLTSGENPVGLLAAISATLRKVHHAGRLRIKRLPLPDACKAAGIPTFPSAVEQTGRQHSHLGPARVDRLPAILLQADLDIKGFSQLPPRLILERLLIDLASPRKD